jgi:hypothetical protein
VCGAGILFSRCGRSWSFSIDDTKVGLRKFFAYAPVVAARPLLCAQTHIGEGAGRKGAWSCGFQARPHAGEMFAAGRKMANRSGRAQLGILPSGGPTLSPFS